MKWIFLLFLSLSTAAVAQETPAPIFSPASGTFTDGVNVTVDAAPQVSFMCTTDGSTPTVSHGFDCDEGSGIISFFSTTTLKAVAIPVFCNGPCIPSAVTTQVYTIIYTPLTTPTLSPAGGTFTTSTGSLEVSINEPSPDGIIHYTLDGSTPSATNGTSLSVNSGGVVIPGGTLKAIAILPNGVSSPVATGTYTVFAQQTPISVPLPLWSIGAFGAALIGVMVRRRRVN
jgi:Chitobiase/beta-hexosaminidase C-terminal domain